nr:hypothetical protein Iba_chr15cCG5380 [Ipomoea batatas]
MDGGFVICRHSTSRIGKGRIVGETSENITSFKAAAISAEKERGPSGDEEGKRNMRQNMETVDPKDIVISMQEKDKVVLSTHIWIFLVNFQAAQAFKAAKSSRFHLLHHPLLPPQKMDTPRTPPFASTQHPPRSSSPRTSRTTPSQDSPSFSFPSIPTNDPRMPIAELAPLQYFVTLMPLGKRIASQASKLAPQLNS